MSTLYKDKFDPIKYHPVLMQMKRETFSNKISSIIVVFSFSLTFLNNCENILLILFHSTFQNFA